MVLIKLHETPGGAGCPNIGLIFAMCWEAICSAAVWSALFLSLYGIVWNAVGFPWGIQLLENGGL